jgi:hypothetical protein
MTWKDEVDKLIWVYRIQVRHIACLVMSVGMRPASCELQK